MEMPNEMMMCDRCLVSSERLLLTPGMTSFNDVEDTLDYGGTLPEWR